MTAVVERRHAPDAVERVLRSLPDWFGIEEAVLDYVTKAETLESFLALEGNEVIGAALVDRHFPESAELTLIAVHASHRNTLAGRALVEAVEHQLRADGCKFLEVHTVGPSYPHEGYAETRTFYRAVGFSPMHEFDGLDWDGPTVVMIKAL